MELSCLRPWSWIAILPMYLPRLFLLPLSCLFLSSCAEDWDYFWHGDGSAYAPASGGYTSPSYTPTAAPSYSDVESQDQKMRNYGQQLDKQIHDSVY